MRYIYKMKNDSYNNCVWIIGGWEPKDLKQIIDAIPRIRRISEKLVICFMHNKTNNDTNRIIGSDYLIECEIDNCSINSQYEFLLDFFNTYTPKFVFFIDGIFSKIIATKLAVTLKKGLVSDCIDVFQKDDCKIEVIRTATSSSALVTVGYQHSDYGIAVIRGDIFSHSDFLYGNTIPEKFNAKIPEKSTLPIAKVYNYKIRNQDINYKRKKNIIFIAGMGLKEKSNIQKLCRLAKIFNSDIGASRAVIEKKYLKYDYQIGQSGKSIDHEICILFGISGAIQHVCGIHKAKTIIAINNDPNAEIFKYSDYKIVTDAVLLLDNLLKQCSKSEG